MKYIFVALFVLAGIGLISYNYANKTVTTPNASVTQAYTQDPTLLAYASNLGIDVSHINLVLSPTIPHATDLSGQAVGVYNTATTTIYVSDNEVPLEGGTESSDDISTLAYEYMHYIWAYDLSASAKTQQTTTLEQYSNTNSAFNKLVNMYQGSQDTLGDEYTATACTELDPSVLSTGFNTWCDTYIPNRETVLF